MKYFLLISLITLSGCGTGFHINSNDPFWIGVENKVNAVIHSDCFKSGLTKEVYEKFLSTKNVHVKVEKMDDAAKAIICGNEIKYSPHIRNMNDGLFAITQVTIHELAHLLCYEHPKDYKDPQYAVSIPVIASAVARECMKGKI